MDDDIEPPKVECVMPDGGVEERVIDTITREYSFLRGRDDDDGPLRAYPRVSESEEVFWVIGDPRPHIRKAVRP